MRHFIAYHNAKRMGYSCEAIPEPRVKTAKSVLGLKGATIWLISGEGERPKSYFLASTFLADRCDTNIYPGTDLPNEISGTGRLFGKTIPLDRTILLDIIRRETANFVSGLSETHNPKVIAGLRALV